MSNESPSSGPPFLLFEGGPFARLFNTLAPASVDFRGIARSVALIALITWVPMALLAALQGVALLPDRRGSFLLDAAMYARFWVAMPVLLLTSVVCGPRLHIIVQNFLKAGLVKESEREQFSANVTYVLQSASSRLSESVLLVFAFLYSAYLLATSSMGLTTSWRILGSEGHLSVSWAGWWWVAISQPLYGFASLRVLYRILMLWRFLWRTSRLDLQLIASHPDQAGGLGFLGLALPRLSVPAFAMAAGLAGGLANLVLWTGTTVADYKYTVLFFVALIVVVFASPLLFFYVPLRNAKIQGKLSYGALARRQLRQFEQKWVASTESDAGILGGPDFSSVIDLHDTVATVGRMRVVPFKRGDILALILSTLAPFLPVVALEIPVKEILAQLLKLVA